MEVIIIERTVMKILNRIVLALSFPVYLSAAMEPSANAWIQEALLAQQSASWMATDKTGENILVEAEVVSKNSKILAASLNDLANMYADAMSKPLETLAIDLPR